jgi:hypothetical protein
MGAGLMTGDPPLGLVALTLIRVSSAAEPLDKANPPAKPDFVTVSAVFSNMEANYRTAKTLPCSVRALVNYPTE